MFSGLIILWMYLSFQETYIGYTFGEKILGLKLNKKISFKTGLIRNLTKSILILFLPIDIFPILKNNLRWLEILTNSKLIYEPSLSSIYRKVVE